MLCGNHGTQCLYKSNTGVVHIHNSFEWLVDLYASHRILPCWYLCQFLCLSPCHRYMRIQLDFLKQDMQNKFWQIYAKITKHFQKIRPVWNANSSKFCRTKSYICDLLSAWINLNLFSWVQICAITSTTWNIPETDIYIFLNGVIQIFESIFACKLWYVRKGSGHGAYLDNRERWLIVGHIIDVLWHLPV